MADTPAPPDLVAVRGATRPTADTPEDIADATRRMLDELLAANDLRKPDVISLLFTATPDLTGDLPALAAAEAGWHDVPMLCAAEMPVPNAMTGVIRVLAHVRWGRPGPARHVYLRGTAPTRPEPATAS
jgi:chorismate mutase